MDLGLLVLGNKLKSPIGDFSWKVATVCKKLGGLIRLQNFMGLTPKIGCIFIGWMAVSSRAKRRAVPGKLSSEILLSSAAMDPNLQTKLRPRKLKGKNHCV